MTQRPTTFPDWATANPAGIVQPPQSQVETGWVPNEPIPAAYMNSLQSSTAAWLHYLDSQTNSVSLASTLEPSMRLLSSATLNWNLTSTTLSWSAPMYLAYPGAADSNNTIPAGSAVIPSGSVAYVVANAPFSTTASTTSGSPQLTNVAYADQIGVGWAVSGPGIPANTTVQSLGSDGTSVQMTSSATATAGAVTLSFASSGSLAVQVASMATLTPAANLVVLARATETRVYVGVGTGQMVLHDGESKLLLEDGFAVRRLTAGSALTQLQAVYISRGAADTTSAGVSTNRTAGQVFPADASSGFATRAGVVGFAISNQASGDSSQIATSGLLGGFSSLTPGAPYWLDPTTPGGITSAKPTGVGQFETPVGIAATQSSLLINPAAADMSRPVPNNLTLPGTLTANSVVSAQGFAQQVDMGRLYLAAGKNMYDSGQGKVVPQGLQTYYANFGAAGGNPGTRYWPAGANGSILRLQIFSNLQLTSALVYQVFAYTPNMASPQTPLIQGSFGASLSQTVAGVYYGIQSFSKGTYVFDATTVFLVKLGFGSSLTSDMTLSCDMTVEMSA